MASAQSDRKPHRGDLIEIFRGLYQHWAVYIGRGYVVHLAAPSEVPGAGANSMMSVLSVNAMVKKEKLQDVVGTDRWQINNSLDVKYKPRPVDDIVREACALVGQERLYRIFRGNCAEGCGGSLGSSLGSSLVSGSCGSGSRPVWKHHKTKEHTVIPVCGCFFREV